MRIQQQILALALTTLMVTPAAAQYLQAPQGAIVDNSVDTTVPSNNATMQQAQRYETVTGGVTGEERAELDAAQRGKSTKLVFAATNGEYLGDVAVMIKTAKGEEVSNFMSDGPYAFIALPAGSYTVTATAKGETRTQKITVGAGQKTYTLRYSPQ